MIKSNLCNSLPGFSCVFMCECMRAYTVREYVRVRSNQFKIEGNLVMYNAFLVRKKEEKISKTIGTND